MSIIVFTKFSISIISDVVYKSTEVAPITMLDAQGGYRSSSEVGRYDNLRTRRAQKFISAQSDLSK